MRRAGVIVAACLVVAACGGGGGGGDKWAIGPKQGQPYTPVFINSQVAVGENRFLFSLLGPAGLPAAAPDVDVDVAFYDLAGSRDAPATRADGVFANTVPDEPGHGLYIARATFGRAGDWGAEITARPPGRAAATVRGRFSVVPQTTFPSAGQPAPPADTPTLADVGGDLSRLTTDPQPDASLYRISVADAIAAKKPFVLVFSTPRYCTSRVCGPTLDQVKAARTRFPTVDVIHVEVVDPKNPLDERTGDLKTVPAMAEWRLQTEPWVFVVGPDAKVAAAFEGMVTEPELVDAVNRVTASR